MSFSTLFGVLIGFGLFLGAIVMNTSNYDSFVSLSSMMIVMGGTLSTAFISYQARYVMLAIKGILQMFQKPRASREHLTREVMHLIKWGYVVQTKGLVALDKEIQSAKIDQPLLRYGADLVATGYKPEQVREMMEIAVESTYERDSVPVDVLKSMASTAPAFGMIGTLVGLIIMLQGLGEDLSQLGLGLAVALLTTLYGVVLARLVFLPAAVKMEQKEDMARFRNILVAEGLSLLSEKQSPRVMQDKLNSYLDPAIHFDIDRQLK